MMRFTTALVAASVLAIPAAPAADAKQGEKVFEECRACHVLERASNGVGPSLIGVVGRKAGELDDFRYSPAMKRSNLTWTRQNLDAFLADPQKVVPANRMPYSGLPDQGDRAALIEFLQGLK